MILLNDCAISCCSKKQSCITISTMEAEYVAYSSVIHEIVWLIRLLQDLEVVKTTFEPMTLCCDNMVALSYAKDPKYHGKTKYIQIIYHVLEI